MNIQLKFNSNFHVSIFGSSGTQSFYLQFAIESSLDYLFFYCIIQLKKPSFFSARFSYGKNYCRWVSIWWFGVTWLMTIIILPLENRKMHLNFQTIESSIEKLFNRRHCIQILRLLFKEMAVVIYHYLFVEHWTCSHCGP